MSRNCFWHIYHRIHQREDLLFTSRIGRVITLDEIWKKPMQNVAEVHKHDKTNNIEEPYHENYSNN